MFFGSFLVFSMGFEGFPRDCQVWDVSLGVTKPGRLAELSTEAPSFPEKNKPKPPNNQQPQTKKKTIQPQNLPPNLKSNPKTEKQKTHTHTHIFKNNTKKHTHKIHPRNLKTTPKPPSHETPKHGEGTKKKSTKMIPTRGQKLTKNEPKKIT